MAVSPLIKWQDVIEWIQLNIRPRIWRHACLPLTLFFILPPLSWWAKHSHKPLKLYAERTYSTADGKPPSPSFNSFFRYALNPILNNSTSTSTADNSETADLLNQTSRPLTSAFPTRTCITKTTHAILLIPRYVIICPLTSYLFRFTPLSFPFLPLAIRFSRPTLFANNRYLQSLCQTFYVHLSALALLTLADMDTLRDLFDTKPHFRTARTTPSTAFTTTVKSFILPVPTLTPGFALPPDRPPIYHVRELPS